MNWISVEDRLPSEDDGDWVLLWHSGKVPCPVSVAHVGFVLKIKDLTYGYLYTHWALHPSGPKLKEK